MIDTIDHFVLTVRDIGAACDFYARTLGMQVVTFGNGRKALQFGEFGEHKINDVCFITRTPLERVVGHLRSCDVEILDGPVKRTGPRS